MEEIIADIRAQLTVLECSVPRSSVQLFFKEPVKTYGIKVPVVRSIAKKILPHLKSESKEFVFDLCETLLKSGYLEEAIIACEFSYSQRKKFESDDFKRFEKWIAAYIDNWASCDTFCNHTVGEFLQKHPKHLKHLKKWAVSDQRWVKRAAAVSLIIPARNGDFMKEALEIATLQLHDTDDMVQKGYGWLLKVTANKHQQQVFEFVLQHKNMPRTALRYAIEKMPEALKKEAMSK